MCQKQTLKKAGKHLVDLGRFRKNILDWLINLSIPLFTLNSMFCRANAVRRHTAYVPLRKKFRKWIR